MQERLPRSTGELLSDAMSVLRRHFKTFILLSMPFCAMDLILREAGQSAMQTVRTRMTEDPSRLGLDELLQILGAGAGGIGMFLGSAILLQVLACGLVGMSSQAWAGRTPGVQDALGVITSRSASLIVTALLFILAIAAILVVPSVLLVVLGALAGPIGAVVGGLLAVAVIVVGIIALTLRWGLYSQTVVVEGHFGPAAFSRSSALMDGRGLPFLEGAKFRLSVLFLITFALSGTLQSLFAIPRLGVAVATGWQFADGMPPLASMPLWFIVPFGLIEVVTNSLVVPFSSVLLTLFYFDLRVRYEALDLEPGAVSSPTTPTASLRGPASPP